MSYWKSKFMLAFRYVDRNDNEQGFKMKAGWKNILKNETMLLPHTRNANFMNIIRVSMHKLADSKKANKHVHKENHIGRLTADENGVQDLANYFPEFE